MPQALRPSVAAPCRGAAPTRAAYTMTELMVVLGILLAIVSVSWPALMRPWSRNLSRQAAQQFAEDLQSARLRAIEESRVYRLRWQPGAPSYQIDAPFDVANSGLDPAIRSSQPKTLADPTLSAAPEPAETSPTNDALTLPPSGDSADVELSMSASPTQPFSLSRQLESGVRFLDERVTQGGLQSSPTQLLEQTADPFARRASELTDQQRVDDPDRLQDAMQDALLWSEPVWFYPDGRTSNGHWTLRSDTGYQVDVRLRGLTGTVRVDSAQRVPQPEADVEVPADDALGAPLEEPPSDSLNEGEGFVPVHRGLGTSP